MIRYEYNTTFKCLAIDRDLPDQWRVEIPGIKNISIKDNDQKKRLVS